MNTEKLITMVNEFLDGELPKEKENFLFTGLGNDETAREYFKKLNSLKLITNETAESFPQNLDLKILTELKDKEPVGLFHLIRSRSIAYVSVLLLVISLLTGYYLFEQTNIKKEELILAKAKIEQQEKLINLVMTNQLSPVTVYPTYDNEIIIKADL
ncbi:hypothetical protein ASZ90_004212 [hydrocarbon metagenome]|uniref:Uncharacterized protein n=1 Tax=hydrocarbon metagenome TaxID=938273 RepID=A0A0W8FYP2_9ZZZZ